MLPMQFFENRFFKKHFNTKEQESKHNKKRNFQPKNREIESLVISIIRRALTKTRIGKV